MAARFLNWSQTVSACPAEVAAPASEDEVLARRMMRNKLLDQVLG